ncbi:MAG: SAF domain-containing protein [Oscillochloridaceae bacterium umkhey_bin13]
MAAATPNPTTSPTLGQALSRKKTNPVPMILLVVGLLGAIALAILGYLESQRTEQVVILTRPVAYGQRITAEDVGVVEVALHRPVQLAGITNQNAVVGKYAARNLGVNDLAQPGMLMNEPPLQPVYPNGEELAVNMVPMPFSVATLGPVTARDRVNIGFTANDPELCDPSRTAAVTTAQPGQITDPATVAQTRPFACRLVSYARILWVDGNTAYLELTPYQAQSLWALQAAGVPMWGERYGVASDPLPAVERLDAGQVNVSDLLAPAPTPLPREDPLVAPQIPGANAAPVPGSRP